VPPFTVIVMPPWPWRVGHDLLEVVGCSNFFSAAVEQLVLDLLRRRAGQITTPSSTARKVRVFELAELH
jgi:hypothetical protein